MSKLRMQMTDEEKLADDIDRERWTTANEMYKKWGKKHLQNWLSTHTDVEYREDIRRRLNVIRLNRAGTKHANASRRKR